MLKISSFSPSEMGAIGSFRVEEGHVLTYVLNDHSILLC